MIPRTIYSGEHELFRDGVRAFIEAEVTPHHAAWEAAGIVSREVWRNAGKAGLLCCAIPEAYGGAGADFLFAPSSSRNWRGPARPDPPSTSIPTSSRPISCITAARR